MHTLLAFRLQLLNFRVICSGYFRSPHPNDACRSILNNRLLNCPLPSGARRFILNNKLAISKVTRRIAACHRGAESTRRKEPRKLSRRPQTVHTQAHTYANASTTHQHTHTDTNIHTHANTHTHTTHTHTSPFALLFWSKSDLIPHAPRLH